MLRINALLISLQRQGAVSTRENSACYLSESHRGHSAVRRHTLLQGAVFTQEHMRRVSEGEIQLPTVVIEQIGVIHVRGTRNLLLGQQLMLHTSKQLYAECHRLFYILPFDLEAEI